MSLIDVRNVVLLLSSLDYNGNQYAPSAVVHNLTSTSNELVYSEYLSGDKTITLSTNGNPSHSTLTQGLMYVPTLQDDDPCQAKTEPYIPANVTREVNLPNTDYNLIALIPWVDECTLSFFQAANDDNLRGMLVFLPDGSDERPPSSDAAVWDLGDDNGWKEENHFPVYAIPGVAGDNMMTQLSLYSGDLADVPNGANISDTYHPDSADYVRVWTELSIAAPESSIAIWALVLAIAGVLVFVVGLTIFSVHLHNKRQRTELRRRVMEGEVDLETLGIKRLRVPIKHIRSFPLFTYDFDTEAYPLPSPQSPRSSSISRSAPSDMEKGEEVLYYQPTCQICLEDFQSGTTIIRELPCGHIFHPNCIDQALSQVSSLCPVCKASMLPEGHCPAITNEMVRRERATQRLRPRAPVTNAAHAGSDMDTASTRLTSWGSSVKNRVSSVSLRRRSNDGMELPERIRAATTSPSLISPLQTPSPAIGHEDGRKTTIQFANG